MNTKIKAGTKTLFTLTDEQIAVNRQPAINHDGLMVATQIQSGLCSNQKECQNAGGDWERLPPPLYAISACYGASCVDKGSGDWD